MKAPKMVGPKKTSSISNIDVTETAKKGAHLESRKDLEHILSLHHRCRGIFKTRTGV